MAIEDAHLKSLQPFVLLYGYYHYNRSPTLNDCRRLDTGQIDQSSDAILCGFRPLGQRANPCLLFVQFWPIWPKAQWMLDSVGFQN